MLVQTLDSTYLLLSSFIGDDVSPLDSDHTQWYTFLSLLAGFVGRVWYGVGTVVTVLSESI